MTVAPWTILSSRAAIEIGRCFPSAFGIYVRRDGCGRYAPRWTRSCSSAAVARVLPHRPATLPLSTGSGFALERIERYRSVSTVMWWRSAVNCSFVLCLAACRTRSSAWVTRSRPCVRSVLCWSAFPLVPARSTGSATGCPVVRRLHHNMAESDFSRPLIVGSALAFPTRAGRHEDVRSAVTGPVRPSYVMGLDLGRASAPRVTAPHMCSAHKSSARYTRPNHPRA